MSLSIFYFGREIKSSFNSFVKELVLYILRVLGSLRVKHKIVKVRNGNMNIAKEIVTMLNLRVCSSFELEFVDERKINLEIKNFTQREKHAMLSVKYISQREYYRHFVLPFSITG